MVSGSSGRDFPRRNGYFIHNKSFTGIVSHIQFRRFLVFTTLVIYQAQHRPGFSDMGCLHTVHVHRFTCILFLSSFMAGMTTRYALKRCLNGSPGFLLFKMVASFYCLSLWYRWLQLHSTGRYGIWAWRLIGTEKFRITGGTYRLSRP
jgi:hypothetical protein